MVQDLESFVDAALVAAFLGIKRRRVLELVQIKGGIPSHPVPGRGDGTRKTNRFLLSEVRDWMLRRKNG